MIIIIDDDINMSTRIKEELTSYQIRDIHLFSCTKDCSLSMIDKAELIFLDIEMPDETGLEFAKRIRKKDPNKKIIFISSHEEYVFDSFTVQPFFFIRKSYFKTDFDKAMNSYREVMSNNLKDFVYKANDIDAKIKCKDILFFEKDRNKIIIHVVEGNNIKIADSLTDIQERVDADFILINRGQIINLFYLANIVGYNAILNSGEKLEISRRRKTEVKQALMQYIRRNSS